MPARPRSAVLVAVSVAATVVVLCLVGVVMVNVGAFPANADSKPGPIETWAAKTSLHATLDRDARALQNPLPVNDSTLTLGVRLYGIRCAVCHGAADGKPSPIATGLYQKAPQFAKHDVTDDPVSQTYWKITHGIRLTGMPAFSRTLKPEQRWAIALFLSRQDSLPPGALAAWKKLPSAARDTAG